MLRGEALIGISISIFNDFYPHFFTRLRTFNGHHLVNTMYPLRVAQLFTKSLTFSKFSWVLCHTLETIVSTLTDRENTARRHRRTPHGTIVVLFVQEPDFFLFSQSRSGRLGFLDLPRRLMYISSLMHSTTNLIAILRPKLDVTTKLPNSFFPATRAITSSVPCSSLYQFCIVCQGPT